MLERMGDNREQPFVHVTFSVATTGSELKLIFILRLW
jgi:hypothetical protein